MPSGRKPGAKPGTRADQARRENGRKGGRPRERPGPGGISWTVVRHQARLGADRDLIVAAMGITPEQLADPEVIARLADEIKRGAALERIDILEDVRRLRSGGDGSVNAVLASLKQKHQWLRPESGKTGDEPKPDQAAAVAEIQRMLGRFRAPR